jgi:hypothetical protein
LLRDYRSLALSDLLSTNLDTIGHSKAPHSIQDRTLEQQFFELIINPASLQPVADVNLLEWRSKDLFAERYSQRCNDLERNIGWK